MHHFIYCAFPPSSTCVSLVQGKRQWSINDANHKSGSANCSAFIPQLYTHHIRIRGQAYDQNSKLSFIFYCHKYRSGRLRGQRSCLWVAMGGSRSILSVSVFRGPTFVPVIMIDGSVNHKP